MNEAEQPAVASREIESFRQRWEGVSLDVKNSKIASFTNLSPVISVK